ncbi:MAG: hypothetical protein FJ042_02530 [Candidatus Cloacimonetes bacterium]|nr:hypothetical protein [Candidatus Cloacimonadota bacterium]
MIKRIVILFVCIFAWALYAQTGLFDLTYGEALSTAKGKLSSAGFVLVDQSSSVVEYTPSEQSKSYNIVDGIILIVNPGSDKTVGWFIKYNGENTTELDSIVLDALLEMHGENNEYDESTDQLLWNLGGTRSLHVMYTMENCLSILYFDSAYEELFSMD